MATATDYKVILYRFRVIASYLSKAANFNLRHLHWPRSNFAVIFGARKRVLGYGASLFVSSYV